jgi:hypothetical protein
MFTSKWPASGNSCEDNASGVSARLGVQLDAEGAAPAGAEVMFHHAQATSGEVLHVYVDGEYYRAVPLGEGCTETQVHVDGKRWRSNSAVHAIDAYQASANGRVIEHQSVMVTASAQPGRAAQAHAQDRSGSRAAYMQADVDVVEYRVSRDGQPFGAWYRDYVEPASDGSEDGDYVVQMRFLDINRQVLDLQTLSFVVQAGLVLTT